MSLLPLPDAEGFSLPDFGLPSFNLPGFDLPKFDLPSVDPFSLSGSVGLSGDNDRADVIKAQVLFGNTGDFDLGSLGAPTGWPGGELDRAMRRFQKDRGLTIDGLMLPQGETLQALRSELGDSLKGYSVPTPDEVDRYYTDSNSVGEQPRPLPAIVTSERLDGHPIGVIRPAQVVSDVDDAPAPVWQPGAQLAQATPLAKPAPATKTLPARDANSADLKPENFKLRATHPALPPLPPVPRHKAATFDRPENEGAWEDFQASAQRQLPDGPVQRAVFGGLYAEEGGRLEDPKTKAVGGILPGTLEDMRNRGKLPAGLPANAKPVDLTPDQQVSVYRAYFNDVLGTAGGSAALETLHPDLAKSVADTMFADGRGDGAKFLQKAVIAAGGKVADDGKMGPQLFSAFQAMSSDPDVRDRLLNAITVARVTGKKRLPSEIGRINLLGPASDR